MFSELPPEHYDDLVDMNTVCNDIERGFFAVDTKLSAVLPSIQAEISAECRKFVLPKERGPILTPQLITRSRRAVQRVLHIEKTAIVDDEGEYAFVQQSSVYQSDRNISAARRQGITFLTNEAEDDVESQLDDGEHLLWGLNRQPEVHYAQNLSSYRQFWLRHVLPRHGIAGVATAAALWRRYMDDRFPRQWQQQMETLICQKEYNFTSEACSVLQTMLDSSERKALEKLLLLLGQLIHRSDLSDRVILEKLAPYLDDYFEPYIWGILEHHSLSVEIRDRVKNTFTVSTGKGSFDDSILLAMAIRFDSLPFRRLGKMFGTEENVRQIMAQTLRQMPAIKNMARNGTLFDMATETAILSGLLPDDPLVLQPAANDNNYDHRTKDPILRLQQIFRQYEAASSDYLGA